MANRSILGGSPLGLIGVKSSYGPDNLSTFNAGKTRNVNVPKYNQNLTDAGALYGNSLFSGYRLVRAWPDITKNEDGTYDTKGTNDVIYQDYDEKDANGNIKKSYKRGDKSKRRTLHNNDVYDTSILHIIEKLSGTKASLRPADFAYLKNVGVYPNNRLMIARRFASPSDDNIMVNKRAADVGSFATLISWKPENEDFLDISFGEEWQDAEADFKGLLTQLGEDLGIGNLGGISGAAGNTLPLPGFTEIFQRNFLFELGLLEENSKDSIPAGNPNLIKQAKRRKLIGYSEAGSGLKCTVNIKMICEYELKYISGIDPTIVWMDLLGMIARFGTSNSETYGLSRNASSKLINWVNNPNILIEEATTALSKAIDGIITAVTKAIEDAYNAAMNAAKDLSDSTEPEKPKPPVSQQDAAQNAALDEKNKQGILANALASTLNAAKKTLSALLQKYRVRIIGIVNALSGLPSTPWHITIGNPLRPVFCSGDMLVENVNIKLGPNLAFNDLPSSITVEFNLTNARNWGLQEIMSKFNSGYVRTVDVQKTFYETNQVKIPNDTKTYIEPVGILPFNNVSYGSSGTSGSSGSSGVSGNNSGNNNENPQSGATGSTGTSGISGTSGSSLVNPPNNVNNTSRAQDNKLSPGSEMRKDASASVYDNSATTGSKLSASDISKLSPSDRQAYLSTLTPEERAKVESSTTA